MSVVRRPLNAWLRLTEKRHLRRALTPAHIRRAFETKARWFFHAPRGISTRALRHGGLDLLELTTSRPGPRNLYIHGGGFVFGSPRTHHAMLARLTAYTGGTAWLPDYPKAPEHPFPAALEHLKSVYLDLCSQGPIVLGGDSAGGALAFALLGDILREDLPKPIGIFGFSPLTDLTFSGDSFHGNAHSDVVLPAERAHELAAMYVGAADARDPRVSPLFADFSGAPRVWLTAGSTEILLDDTQRLADRLQHCGAPVTKFIEHDLPHVWPIFHNFLPEARRSLRSLARWINDLPQTATDS